MEYNKYELQEIASMKYGKMPKKDKIVDKGYPIYSGYKITGFYEEYMYDDEMIIVVARGVGGTGDVKLSPPKSYITNLSIILDTNENLVDKKYLQLLLHSMKLKYLDSGSAQSQITINDLKRLKICLPNIKHQKKISSFIKLINRKIEINQNIITNLKKLSQTLFKRWFVDFEFPDEDGNPYKSSGGEMIDSEIGEIPKGWEISKLDKIINIKSGKRPRNKVNIMDNKNNTPIIGASKIMGYTSDYLESEPILVMGRVGTHGVIQRFNNNVWPSDNTFIIKSKFMIYTYFILINIDYKSLNRGSTQPLLSQKDIKNINIIIPKSDSLIVKYEEITNIYFKEVDVIKDQISYLIELRDTLLPKLMSGELEIPDDIEVNIDEFSI